MPTAPSPTGLQLRSLVTSDRKLELSLVEVPTPEPGPDEVVVRVGGAPINPSDLALLLGMADVRTATVSGSGVSTVLTAPIPAEVLGGLKARFGESMPVGNEGGGIVVAAGSSDAAQALVGRTVGFLGGAAYSQYRCVKVSQCLLLPEGVAPAEAASCFVNPLTALAMTETMRMEGHTALVHTAAASNLGQMLNKICIADGITLLNIVRKPEQATLLRGIGATHVVDSSAPTFMED